MDSRSGRPADVWEVIYFSGFTLFTLGVGDFRPNGAAWQVLTPAVSATGFALMTLFIAYLLQVISSAVDQRHIAVYLRSFGRTPEEIVITAWERERFPIFSQHLIAVSALLAKNAQQHLAFPVLRYFHSPDESAAISLRLAALDEALTLLTCGLPDEHRPHAAAVQPARRMVAEILDSYDAVFREDGAVCPPPPSLQELWAAGIQTVSEAEFSASLEDLAERRRQLHQIVRNDGWRRSDIGQTREHQTQSGQPGQSPTRTGARRRGENVPG